MLNLVVVKVKGSLSSNGSLKKRKEKKRNKKKRKANVQHKSHLCYNLALTVLASHGKTKFTPGEEEARGHGTHSKPGKQRRTLSDLE